MRDKSPVTFDNLMKIRDDLLMPSYSDPKLKKIVEILNKEFRPLRLFLFGSRANNTNRTDSDYDFVLIVSELTSSKSEGYGRARQLLWNLFRVKVDVWIYDEKQFNDWKDEFNSIPETALNTGQELSLANL